MKEIWKDIPGYEGLYIASNLGNIKSVKRNKLLKFHTNQFGYYTLTLCKNNKKNTRSVHRMVAKAFIQNTLDKPLINHINGVKTDNHIENLEWATSIENNRHAVETGLRDDSIKRLSKLMKERTSEDSLRSFLTEKDVLEIRNSDKKYVVLAKLYNVHPTTISDIMRHKTWNKLKLEEKVEDVIPNENQAIA